MKIKHAYLLWTHHLLILSILLTDVCVSHSQIPKVDINIEGHVAVDPEKLIKQGVAYFIKNKSNQKVCEVENAVNPSNKRVEMSTFDGKEAQKFVFEPAGEKGYYFIKSVLSSLRLTWAVGEGILIQDIPYSDTNGTKISDAQKWKATINSEAGTMWISAKITGQSLMRVGAANKIIFAQKDGSDTEKWILKITSSETNPNSSDADKGLIGECNAVIKAEYIGLNFGSVEVSVGVAFPEWRGVGENSSQGAPISNYKVLEGKVMKKNAQVSHMDVPYLHFTHDFMFHVKPDPAFYYLLGTQNGLVQEDIEVEWECGLGQNQHSKENPAVPFNTAGKSFGFFSAGHDRRDVIWNWPTHNDWVHVEGQWIWDRAHPPARTEIHPPRLVAIERYLPDKYMLSGGRYVFATRCDVFANGDGNVQWNNKGLHAFAKKVAMSEKDYVLVFRHTLPRPSPNAKLKAVWKDQAGNTFPQKPVPVLQENGTADILEPHAIVTIPWRTAQISDNAIFARTLYLYWDDVTAHGVPLGFKIKEADVKIDRVRILDKSEGSDGDAGEHRIFANVGSDWIFLNEFIGVNDILEGGLGDSWDPTYSLTRPALPQPSDAEYDFLLNQKFYVYIPENKEFRVHFSGWEADYIDNHFGRVLNPYTSCTKAKQTIESRVNGLDMVSGGCLDDQIGKLDEYIKYSTLVSEGYARTIRKESLIEPGKCDDTKPAPSYEAHFQVLSRKLYEKETKIKVTLQKIVCTSANDNNNPNEEEEPYGRLAVYLSSPVFNRVDNNELGDLYSGILPQGYGTYFLNITDDENLSLKKGQEHKFSNASKVYTFSLSDDPDAAFITWGKMMEDDGSSGHDELECADRRISLAAIVKAKKVTFVQKIGAEKTQFEVYYTFEVVED